jgi:hypothetical protein
VDPWSSISLCTRFFASGPFHQDWAPALRRITSPFLIPRSFSCPSTIKIDIFFLELVAILSAAHHAATLPHPPRRVLIWFDSFDSVSVLASLAASDSIHNGVVLAIARIILMSGIDLRVRHIAGKKNVRADPLSRFLLDDFRREFPSVRVHLFAPPRELLLARWRECF